jgi:hypothetical protein
MPLSRDLPLVARGSALPTLFHRAYRDFTGAVFVPSVSSVLNPLESADPQNVALTLAESALPNLLDLKSLIIRTSKKIRGSRVLLLTRHAMKDVCPERPSGIEGSLSDPMPILLSAPLTMRQWLSILLHLATGTTHLFRQICGSFLTAIGTSLARVLSNEDSCTKH